MYMYIYIGDKTLKISVKTPVAKESKVVCFRATVANFCEGVNISVKT